MKTKVVTLVRHSSKLYPKTDTDFVTLREHGAFCRFIDISYMAVFKGIAPGIKFVIVTLQSEEQAMLEKFQRLWPDSLEITERHVKLSFPRGTNQDLIDKGVDALTRFYQRHYIILEQTVSKRGKLVRMQFTKTLTLEQ